MMYTLKGRYAAVVMVSANESISGHSIFTLFVMISVSISLRYQFRYFYGSAISSLVRGKFNFNFHLALSHPLVYILFVVKIFSVTSIYIFPGRIGSVGSCRAIVSQLFRRAKRARAVHTRGRVHLKCIE